MFFCSATGRAELLKGRDRFHFALGDRVGRLGGVERHQDGVEVVAAQRFGHGGAVVVAGDADEAGDFLLFQLLYGGEHAVGPADAFKVVEVAQAVDLNQIDVVGLQELETRLDRTERAVAISRIDLGGEKNFFAALSWKIRRAVFRSIVRSVAVCTNPRCRSN